MVFKISEFNERLGRAQMIKVISNATIRKFLDQLEKAALRYSKHKNQGISNYAAATVTQAHKVQIPTNISCILGC